MPSEFLYQTGPHTCQSFELSIFLIFEDIEFVFLLLARASVLVIYTTHHHMEYTGARFLPRLSWHIVRLSCQFRLMSLTCPPGICPPGIRVSRAYGRSLQRTRPSVSYKIHIYSNCHLSLLPSNPLSINMLNSDG